MTTLVLTSIQLLPYNLETPCYIMTLMKLFNFSFRDLGLSFLSFIIVLLIWMMSFLHVGRSNLFVYNEKFDYIRILLFSIFYQIGAIFFVTFIVSKFLKIWIIYIFSILLTILIIYYQLPHQITLLTTPLPNGNYDYVVYNMQTFAELSVRPCVTTMVKQKGSPDYFNLGNKKIIKEIRRVNSICIDYSRKPNFQNFEYPL